MLEAMVLLANKVKENKMKAICNFRQFKTIAKSGVQMHGSWLAMNSLNSDRTPEGYISSGFQEGSGYA
jgi:hypothetical protein